MKTKASFELIVSADTGQLMNGKGHYADKLYYSMPGLIIADLDIKHSVNVWDARKCC